MEGPLEQEIISPNNNNQKEVLNDLISNTTEKDIPSDFVSQELSKLESDKIFKIVQNAVASTKINVVGINRSLLNSIDEVFSHKLDSWKVTNQKSSGRCWIFAGVNLFKEPVIKETGSDFEFSQNYIAVCINEVLCLLVH